MSSGDNSCDTSADILAAGRGGASPVTTMRDVAAVAGVSVATVSNVLNNPHLVAARTRTRVEKAVHELNFQPDPLARELRGRSRLGADAKNPGKYLDGDPSTREPEDAADRGAVPERGQETPRGALEVRSGEHVTVQVGSEILSGTVDAVMPDNSYFWIWADSGMGRRLIEAAAVSTDNGPTGGPAIGSGASVESAR